MHSKYIISSVEELFLIPEGERMCDDLLEMLLGRVDHPQSGTFTIDELRSGFWGLVFSDGWKTTIPSPEPLPFTPMRQAGIHSGSYIDDTPDDKLIPTHRKASFKVHLTDNEDLFFGWYTVDGRHIRQQDVECSTEQDELRASAISQRDAEEISWVSQWNSWMIKFWGRRHLLNFVSWLNDEADSPANGLPENIENLQKPGLYRQILLKSIKRERVEMGRIAKNETQNLSVADLYGSHQRNQIQNMLKEDEFHVQRLRDAREVLRRLSTAPSQVDLSAYFW